MFDELIAILDRFQDLYGLLLDHAAAERDAVIRADIEVLQRLNTEKVALLARAERLESARRKAMVTLAAQLPDYPATVSALAAAADGPLAEQLRRKSARLKETIGRLRTVNHASMDLITHSLRVVCGSLQLLGITTRQGVYARSGRSATVPNRRVLSAKA